ncbi:hypothetical protein P4574_19245, partial [Priestia megaterium]|nr:hypothetical protein [Priestia megaterium]
MKNIFMKLMTVLTLLMVALCGVNQGYWINDFNITIMKIGKLVVVLVNNNQILIRWLTCCFCF